MANIPVIAEINNLLDANDVTIAKAALGVLGAATTGNLSIVAGDIAAGAVTADKITNATLPIAKTIGLQTALDGKEDQSAILFPVTDYNASGQGATTTTGTISASSPTLTVTSASTFAVGQGILIAGAGTAGARFVSTISTIVGNVITLSTSAVTAVTNAAVKHDDSAAINAAIAAAFNAGGGTVYFPVGNYRCAAPLNTTTNSVITFPQNTDFLLSRRQIYLVGDAPGHMSVGFQNILTGGVALDFSDVTASGTQPSAIAGAPWVEVPNFNNIYTEWNSISVFIDKMLIVVTGNTINGINMNNVQSFQCGNDLAVHAKATGPQTSLLLPALTDPTTSLSSGIIFPAVNNTVKLNCGSAYVVGFYHGILSGEHANFYRPTIAFCKIGLLIRQGGHLQSGTVNIENCRTLIKADASSFFDIRLEGEISSSSSWWQGVYGIENFGVGRLAYKVFSYISSNFETNFPIVDTATNCSLYDIQHKKYRGVEVFKSARVDESFTIKRLTTSDYGLIIWNTTGIDVLSLGTRFGSNDLYISGSGGTEHVRFGQSTGNITALTGEFITNTVGKTLKVKSGTNALAGTVTLVAGTATITSSAIDVNTVIILSLKTSGGTPGLSTPRSDVLSGSATITGAGTDTSTYNWVGLKVN